MNDNEMIDFFKKCMSDNTNDDDIEDNNCLISGEKLINDNIKLLCGHSFNYLPLFNDIFKQKRIINHREIVRIPYKCIKCPYCRTINNGLLPYKEHIVKDKIDGVNYPEKYSLKSNICSYVFKSGKKKGLLCKAKCCDKFCTQHKTIGLKQEDEKNNCKMKCSYMIGSKNGKRQCKKYAKNKGLCAIHLKLNT